jgi:hypothetical protein
MPTSIRALLKSWTREVDPAGSVFTHPGGPARGRIRIRDRQALRPMAAWIAEVAGDRAPTLVTDPEPVDTAEGELAALVSIRVNDGEHTIGVVFGDDWCFVVDASTGNQGSSATLRAIARAITETTYLGLGERRRRRTIHRGPAGWTEERRARATRYLPPGHPEVRGLITVDDAMPRGLSADEEVERTYVVDGFARRESDEPATEVKVVKVVKGEGGSLNGLVRWYRAKAQGGVVIGARAELGDDRFLYRQHLSGRAEHEPLLVQSFLEVVYSVKPLPRPWPRRAHAETSYAD